MQRRWVFRGLKFAAIALVALGLFGFVVMSLWNWLAPPVLGAHAIDYWQALGLIVLSKILFGGFRGHRGYGGHWGGGMKARWEKMTPEEREKFRQGMAGFIGCRGVMSEEPADPRHA